jgi:hypothetical protein
MPHYVTQLGDSFCSPLRSVSSLQIVVGDTKTIGALAKECPTRTKTLSFKPNEKKVLATTTVISEMRQAKT